MSLDEDNEDQCYCKKPVYCRTNFKLNVVEKICATTVIQISDIKCSAPIGLQITYSDKAGKPCDYRKVIPLRTFWKKGWEQLTTNMLNARKRRFIEKQKKIRARLQDWKRMKQKMVALKKRPDYVEPVVDHFKNKMAMIYYKGTHLDKYNPMSWKLIGEADHYSINHLLIKPWQQKTESWDDYMRRFKEAEWKDSNWKLRHIQYIEWKQRKKAEFTSIDKSLETIKMLPHVYKKARIKALKMYRKKQKIERQHPNFRNWSATLDELDESLIMQDEEGNPIEETGFSSENEEEDSGKEDEYEEESAEEEEYENNQDFEADEIE
tara:strand:+ start:1287 stop:2252 length:966 start_codon:yes stop_codon:yes gene_type:complete